MPAGLDNNSYYTITTRGLQHLGRIPCLGRNVTSLQHFSIFFCNFPVHLHFYFRIRLVERLFPDTCQLEGFQNDGFQTLTVGKCLFPNLFNVFSNRYLGYSFAGTRVAGNRSYDIFSTGNSNRIRDNNTLFRRAHFFELGGSRGCNLIY